MHCNNAHRNMCNTSLSRLFALFFSLSPSVWMHLFLCFFFIIECKVQERKTLTRGEGTKWKWMKRVDRIGLGFRSMHFACFFSILYLLLRALSQMLNNRNTHNTYNKQKTQHKQQSKQKQLHTEQPTWLHVPKKYTTLLYSPIWLCPFIIG
jgi:hypothetical protein